MQLAISDQSQGDHQSLIYVLPLAGGTPRRITTTGPSYWHGWSPDGSTLAFCGERNGEFDVYTIRSAAAKRGVSRLRPAWTMARTIRRMERSFYFNSVRSGLMQIWRMKPDAASRNKSLRRQE